MVLATADVDKITHRIQIFKKKINKENQIGNWFLCCWNLTIRVLRFFLKTCQRAIVMSSYSDFTWQVGVRWWKNIPQLVQINMKSFQRSNFFLISSDIINFWINARNSNWKSFMSNIMRLFCSQYYLPRYISIEIAILNKIKKIDFMHWQDST